MSKKRYVLYLGDEIIGIPDIDRFIAEVKKSNNMEMYIGLMEKQIELDESMKILVESGIVEFSNKGRETRVHHLAKFAKAIKSNQKLLKKLKESS